MTQKDGVVRGGAAVVVGVGSGEVLAMASYPTYNLSTFDQDYSKLVSDTVGTPLLNRAIGGAYAPGSTFKPCTAVAALESGIITPSSTIVDRGVYDYYKSPQPRCWIYNEYGGTHGRVNVSQAITVSCNYFFYEVGRLTGIKTLASYAKQFGLGEYTGIEIGGPAAPRPRAPWPPRNLPRPSTWNGPTARPSPPPSARAMTCSLPCSWPTISPLWWATDSITRPIC